MELEGTRDCGAQECFFGLRVPRSELLKLLDKWEVLELVDELLEGDTKCVTCGKVFCIKKLLEYHGRNRQVGLDIVIPVTNTLTE